MIPRASRANLKKLCLAGLGVAWFYVAAEADQRHEFKGEKWTAQLEEILAKESTSLEDKVDAIAELFYTWAEKEPEPAMAAALALKDRPLRIAALNGALDPVAETKPELAISLYEDFPPDLRGVGAVHFLGKRFAAKHPIKGIDWMIGQLAFHDVAIDKRSAFMAESLRELKSLEGREYWIKRIDELGWRGVLPGEWIHGPGAIHNQMARRDLDGALEWMSENARWAFINWEDREERPRFGGEGVHFATAVLTHGEEAAEALYAKLPATEFRQEFAEGIAEHKAASDPLMALRWIENLDSPRDAFLAGRGLTRVWVRADVDAVLAKLAAEGEDSLLWRETAIEAIVRSDPAKAYHWLRKRVDRHDRWILIRRTNLMRRWSDRDPEAAARAMFEPGGHIRAVRSAFRSWAGSDREAAIKFVESELDEGDSRNAAVAGIVVASEKEDPASARRLAQSITNNDSLKKELLDLLD